MNEFLWSVQRENVPCYTKVEPEFLVKNWQKRIRAGVKKSLLLHLQQQKVLLNDFVIYKVSLSTQFVIILQALPEKDDPLCLPECSTTTSRPMVLRQFLRFEKEKNAEAKNLVCEIILCCSRLGIITALLHCRGAGAWLPHIFPVLTPTARGGNILQGAEDVKQSVSNTEAANRPLEMEAIELMMSVFRAWFFRRDFSLVDCAADTTVCKHFSCLRVLYSYRKNKISLFLLILFLKPLMTKYPVKWKQMRNLKWTEGQELVLKQWGKSFGLWSAKLECSTTKHLENTQFRLKLGILSWVYTCLKTEQFIAKILVTGSMLKWWILLRDVFCCSVCLGEAKDINKSAEVRRALRGSSVQPMSSHLLTVVVPFL